MSVDVVVVPFFATDGLSGLVGSNLSAALSRRQICYLPLQLRGGMLEMLHEFKAAAEEHRGKEDVVVLMIMEVLPPAFGQIGVSIDRAAAELFDAGCHVARYGLPSQPPYVELIDEGLQREWALTLSESAPGADSKRLAEEILEWSQGVPAAAVGSPGTELEFAL